VQGLNTPAPRAGGGVHRNTGSVARSGLLARWAQGNLQNLLRSDTPKQVRVFPSGTTGKRTIMPVSARLAQQPPTPFLQS